VFETVTVVSSAGLIKACGVTVVLSRYVCSTSKGMIWCMYVLEYSLTWFWNVEVCRIL